MGGDSIGPERGGGVRLRCPPETVATLERGDAERAATLVEASFVRAGETLVAALERGDGR